MTTQIAKPSVMSLLLQMRAGGVVISTGTGFVAMSKSGPVLVTNWHNVSGKRPDNGQPLSPSGKTPDEIIIFHNHTILGRWVQRLEPLYKPGGAPRWFEHPTLGNKVDVVALPLNELLDVELFPHDLRDGPAITVGPADVVSVIGFPFGLTAGGALAIWATGFLASEPDVNWNNLPVLLIDCRARQGQSGSAVLSYRGGGAVGMKDGSVSMFSGPVWRLLGIYSGRINDQSDLGMVWKVSAIRDIVDSII